MHNLTAVQRQYDRAEPSESRCDESEYVAPDMTPEQDRSAIRCGSMEEALMLHKAFPDRIVIICTSFKPTHIAPANE